MVVIYKITLCLHIVAGLLALLCGTLSIIFKKGGKWHRFFGKVFFYSMLGVCFTSVYISIYKDSQFLLGVGIFSFYLNYFGFAAIKDKSLRPGFLDWTILSVALVNSFFMIYSLNVVSMVFGAISVYGIILNVKTGIMILQHKQIPALQWLRRHIGMMTGAFIATTTAFLVVNLGTPSEYIPFWLGWLFPTFVLVPLIVYYTKKYTGKSTKINKVSTF